ncbi:rod shape-determining protein MreD [Rhizorhapis suberifaciens]|uniref:Rod shape-determining protein MreD n=1 Tax=Rhizorhapis suberifaciens TaxID=13656 RepID=A0A840HVJ1_9SPHN|nr:rod shape-determining protein MreD [Rhizorhapis suberifaciens]MBB4641496.1 rod shape-determining protein MreD [Rhizorhapis suberifaciens]
MPRYRSTIAQDRSRLRTQGTPIIMVMLGSAMTIMPMIAVTPALPPFGLLALLAWRLLRPELWPLWIAAPLGLFDDIMSGQPLGTAMFLWTVTLIGIEIASSKLLWRDYWQDWLIAAIAIIFCLLGGSYFARLAAGGGLMLVVLPQIVWSILLFPAVVRLCATVDRWRLP